jgi:hypothetical protein
MHEMSRGSNGERTAYRMPLPAATWYATELAAVILDGQGEEILSAARNIHTRTMLLDWCDRCVAAIATRADSERAEGFRNKVHAALRRCEPRLAPPDDEFSMDGSR